MPAPANAADRLELAREISMAIEGNDMNLARALIAEGAAAYGHAALSSAVEAAARQVHEAAVAEHYQASVNAARDVDEPYHAPGLADRQRENLRQFDDGGELVRSWRMGNVSWDYDAWGQTRTIRHVLMDNLDLGCEQAAEQVDSGGGSGGGLAMQAVSAAW